MTSAVRWICRSRCIPPLPVGPMGCNGCSKLACTVKVLIGVIELWPAIDPRLVWDTEMVYWHPSTSFGRSFLHALEPRLPGLLHVADGGDNCPAASCRGGHARTSVAPAGLQLPCAEALLRTDPTAGDRWLQSGHRLTRKAWSERKARTPVGECRPGTTGSALAGRPGPLGPW